MGSPVRTFCFKGNLSQGELKLMHIHPSTNFTEGIWQFNLRQIIYEKNEPHTYSVAVTTKFLKGYEFCNTSQKFKTTSIPFNMFVMNENGPKLVSFDVTWFYINNPENSIEFNFIDLNTNKQLSIDCNVSVLIDVKQVQ
jgi:hypothetical protein